MAFFWVFALLLAENDDTYRKAMSQAAQLKLPSHRLLNNHPVKFSIVLQMQARHLRSHSLVPGRSETGCSTNQRATGDYTN